MKNFMSSNYTYLLGLGERVSLLGRHNMLLKDALDPGFMNQNQKHRMVKHLHHFFFFSHREIGVGGGPEEVRES